MQVREYAREINSLRAALMLRGLDLAKWARINGYKPVTVQTVVFKYWGHPNPPVCGMLTHEILSRLKAEFQSGFEPNQGKVSNGN